MDPRTCLRTTLKLKYQKLNDAYSERSLLPSRLCYRDLQGDYGHANLNQHEFRYIDNSDLHTWLSFGTIPLQNILSCDCQHNSNQRTVITLGVCGVGKTTTVQNCALQWAEGKSYENINLLFPLTFWELNLLQKELNLIELLQTFYPELKKLSVSSLNKKDVWFVIDGLDEYNIPLDFSCPSVSDVTEVTTADILVANLIRGDLLPSAHVWLTTRYSAATQIPVKYLLKQTGMYGFSDEQKEQRFKTIINNDDRAQRAMDHVKISRSLDFLCQIPPICAIMANVLKIHVAAKDGFRIDPLNLTQIYMNLLENSNWEVTDKLKKLALHRLGKANVLYERDLQESGISVEEASTFCKECPLVLREEKGLQSTTVFRFAHSSIQEYLAASAKLDIMEDSSDLSLCCQELVEKVMQNEEEKLDVFLRFLFGQIGVRGSLESDDPLFYYTQLNILENILSYSAVCLFHCIREYNSEALLDEVKFFVKYGYCPVWLDFSPMTWAFMIQRSTNFEGMQDSFKMPLPISCDEKLLKHLPNILKCKKAILRFSNLTDRCCPALEAVLSTKWSYMRELDLGYNCIGDNGVKILVEGLISPVCKLKTLRLQACELSFQACKYLAKALKKSRKLQELDLSRNEIGNVGLQHLSRGLRAPECKLHTLKLSQCNIEQNGCITLATALQENPGYLKVLDLSINTIRDVGANELFEKVNIWKLVKLEMYSCGLTVTSCRRIGEALKYEDSTLVELNLSNNTLKDAGIAFICQGMEAWCRVEKLNLSRCGISEKGSLWLAKVLCSVSKLYSGWTQQTDWQAVELRELDLSMNCLRDQGVKEIAAGLKYHYSHLKTLNLSHCGLTDDCCTELAVGFAAESVISEVDLSDNDLQDKGVKKLCVGIKSPNCKLEKLGLRTCGLTSRSVQFLASALKSNPQHLAELHLMGNLLDDSAIGVLMDLTNSQKYALHTTDVKD